MEDSAGPENFLEERIAFLTHKSKLLRGVAKRLQGKANALVQLKQNADHL
jgi:hypothetical protein